MAVAGCAAMTSERVSKDTPAWRRHSLGQPETNIGYISGSEHSCYTAKCGSGARCSDLCSGLLPQEKWFPQIYSDLGSEENAQEYEKEQNLLEGRSLRQIIVCRSIVFSRKSHQGKE